MECEIVDAGTLSSQHRERWSSIRQQQPLLDAPPFYPEFVCGIAAYIPGCRIAILKRKTDVVGYFVFRQSLNGKDAEPIPMCDYQPLIVKSEHSLDARELIKTTGLRSWKFESALVDQVTFSKTTEIWNAKSPRAILKGGPDAYKSGLIAAGKPVAKFKKLVRVIERDHGPVRLHHGITDEAVLERLLRVKAAQFTNDGRFPPFVQDVLGHFLREKSDRLSGILSMVTVGDREIATVFCLKVDRLLYYWFPTYNQAFQKYSPGVLSLWLLINDLPSLDCDKIDFGPGGEPYKEYFANSHLAVCSGEVHASEMIAVTKHAYNRLQMIVRSSPSVRKVVRPFWRTIKNYHTVFRKH